MINYILIGILTFMIVMSYIHFVKLEDGFLYFDFNEKYNFKRVVRIREE